MPRRLPISCGNSSCLAPVDSARSFLLVFLTTALTFLLQIHSEYRALATSVAASMWDASSIIFLLFQVLYFTVRRMTCRHIISVAGMDCEQIVLKSVGPASQCLCCFAPQRFPIYPQTVLPFAVRHQAGYDHTCMVHLGNASLCRNILSASFVAHVVFVAHRAQRLRRFQLS